MLSLNPTWRQDEFHARVAALSAAKPGGKVLDLGCGRGLTVSHLLAQVGVLGQVVAADRSTRSLEALSQVYPDAFADGRLIPIELDIAGPLPFGAASFDSIVCQNVVECVVDRGGLIAEMARVLRPGGTAVIGHYDFDGVMLASDDPVLTRRMVHGYADHTQAWQDASEGQMGRLLPGLVARSSLNDLVTETVLFIELKLSEEGYARGHLDGMVALSGAFGISEDSATAWVDALQISSDAGCFYYALPWTYVVARGA